MKVLMWNVSSAWADLLYGVSNWTLIAGAFAVFIGTIGSIAMGAAKEYFANERLSANEAATERAKAEAEVAKEGAAKATERAAEADARAAQARLELAKFRAPRTLTREQRIQISTRLLAFRGVKFDGGISGPDPEILTLFAEIGSAAKEAGWIFVDWEGGGDSGFKLTSGQYLGITAVRGVKIQIAKDDFDKLSAPVNALISALNEEGIEATASFDGTRSSENVDVIRILIGPKT
jgi:hypothetical protein